MSKEKSSIKDKLFYDKQTIFDKVTKDKIAASCDFCEGYKKFLDYAKTERECVEFTLTKAKQHEFIEYSENLTLTPGMKLYKINNNKAVTFVVIGSKPLQYGANIIAAHIDVPRIDVRTVPLYEDTSLAYFKTHYYGGIKKYQWLTIPLEIRGTVIAVDGGKTRSVDISIGKDASDPVFVITDILPHLSSEQMKKTMASGVNAENMNILIGSTPSDTEKDESDRVKLYILEHLNKHYGICEKDFLSAELSCVPAFNSRDVGLDRSFVGGYGQDDRVCSYTAFESLIALNNVPEKTAICVLTDKEEIGSEGITSMQSRDFDGFMEDLCQLQGTTLRRMFLNSLCLSADVSNAFDPNYPEVSEKRNDAKVNCGLVLTKYTGSRGKSDASDACAETMAKIRIILETNNVFWQTGQLGRVDAGGGGTIAKYMANRGIETVDAGVPVLCMHSPFEVVSKLDIFMAYEGFGAFYRS